jgi:RimJ/RimL family protein N-acetyltransferase
MDDVTPRDTGVARIRPFAPVDAPAVHAAIQESAAQLTPWLPGIHAGLSRADIGAWIALGLESRAAGTAYQFAIVDARDGGFLGACGLTQLHPYHRFANLYYWVRTGRTGQGIAPAAVRLAVRFGLGLLGLRRIEIVVDVANTASARVAEKAGAQREGVLRNRISYGARSADAIMFSLIPADLDDGR